MTGAVLAGVTEVAFCLLVGWLLVRWAAPRLVSAAGDRVGKVVNYRGRSIPASLGIVWPVWAVGALALGVLNAAVLGTQLEVLVVDVLAGLEPLGLLVLAVSLFGLVDDVYGDRDARGLKGHLSALLKGRMTTGALKSVGIAVVAVAVPAMVIGAAAGTPGAMLSMIAGGAVIALSANLANLLDVRPGRALKGYAAVIATVLVANMTFDISDIVTGRFPLEVWLADGLAYHAAMAALLLGPVVAIWRFDLGEMAVLGDSGANAMGALAGYMVVFRGIETVGSPVWYALVLGVLLALTLLSEFVSFSVVIDRVPPLRWLDHLGSRRNGNDG